MCNFGSPASEFWPTVNRVSQLQYHCTQRDRNVTDLGSQAIKAGLVFQD